MAQPVPVRTGGFGGAEGLAAFLQENGIDLVIDATHPYATRISANAVAATDGVGVPLITLARPCWTAQPGDRWHVVSSIDDAVAALGETQRKVFVALGRQELLPFEAAPQHRYLIRSVDPVEPQLALPKAHYMTARGPFALCDEIALLRQHAINVVVSKNSGGQAAYAKIEAARALKIPVIMVDRPASAHRNAVPDIETAFAAVSHQLSLLEERGE